MRRFIVWKNWIGWIMRVMDLWKIKDNENYHWEICGEDWILRINGEGIFNMRKKVKLEINCKLIFGKGWIMWINRKGIFGKGWIM